MSYTEKFKELFSDSETIPECSMAYFKLLNMFQEADEDISRIREGIIAQDRKIQSLEKQRDCLVEMYSVLR